MRLIANRLPLNGELFDIIGALPFGKAPESSIETRRKIQKHPWNYQEFRRLQVMKKLILFSLSVTLLLTTIILPAHAEGPLSVGTTAPDFTLPSQDNSAVSLAEYKGKWVVLYFYPKDMTSGCTIEAHNFQRDLEKYKAANAVVIGVSLDTAGSHKSFCEKESLTFKLLADPDHRVVDAYGVQVKSYGTMKFASRQTYLINPEGKVVNFWPNVDDDLRNHSANVLAAIAADGK
jgi:peroxiredoxin Q/BCP